MIDFGNERMTEEQAQIIMKSKDEILQSTRAAQQSLFADEEPPRFLIVKRMAERYRSIRCWSSSRCSGSKEDLILFAVIRHG